MRRVGSGQFVYDEVRDWAQYPEGWKTEDAPAVAVDSQDRVYVLIRNKNGVLRFDREGNFQTSWGEDLFERPHGLFVGPDDSVFVVDDWGHTVFKFAPNSSDIVLRISTKGNPADTGYVRGKNRVTHAGPPFNEPTGVAVAPDGSLYVADGYGNARMHKYTAEGELLFSWGEPGNGSGQFDPPHGVWIDENGLVYVSDRLNQRVQLFNADGEYSTEWSAHYPNNICIDSNKNFYVAEMGGVFLYGREAELDKLPARVTVRDASGNVLSEWGDEDPRGVGRYHCPHSIAVDSRGDVYVSEVATSYNFGQAPDDWGVLRKYIRR